MERLNIDFDTFIIEGLKGDRPLLEPVAIKFFIGLQSFACGGATL